VPANCIHKSIRHLTPTGIACTEEIHEFFIHD
jgi:hypothetical protein